MVFSFTNYILPIMVLALGINGKIVKSGFAKDIDGVIHVV